MQIVDSRKPHHLTRLISGLDISNLKSDISLHPDSRIYTDKVLRMEIVPFCIYLSICMRLKSQIYFFKLVMNI